MRTYRFLVEGTDHTGTFMVTCTVRASSLVEGRELVVTHSARAGWVITDWDEQDDMGSSGAGPTTQNVQESGRSYFGGPELDGREESGTKH